MLKKIFLIFSFAFACFMFQDAHAKMFFSDFGEVIRAQDFDGDTVAAIVAKNSKTGKTLYLKNEDKAMTPASLLKVLTFASALNTLGEDYKFETAIYADINSNLYIKLSADPLLSRSDLDLLSKQLKAALGNTKIKKIYIDDSIIDNVAYPDSWLAEDVWPNNVPLSPYIVDNNTVKIRLVLSRDGDSVNIIQSNNYRFSFLNQLNISDKNNIEIFKANDGPDNLVVLSGDISEDCDLEIPVLDPKYFFISSLETAFSGQKISYSDKFYFKPLPNDLSLRKLASVSHSIKEVSTPILLHSDNFVSEVLFKTAGAKWASNRQVLCKKDACLQSKNVDTTNGLQSQSLGTMQNATDMFKDFYTDFDLDKINIADGSGVSKQNLFSAHWICEALLFADKKLKIREYMQTADEGTLKKRLRYLKGNLKAKTGTHKDVSALGGFLSSKDFNDIVFVILTFNAKKERSSLKAYEDDIVDCIFSL